MSLTGVSMPGGGIAVPVPISLINSNSGVLQNQGIFVSSLSGVPGANTVSGTMAGNAATNVSRQQVRIVFSLWLTVLCLACCLLYRKVGEVNVCRQECIVCRDCQFKKYQILYIENFSHLEILVKIMLGRCVKFSLSPIIAISRTLNEDLY